LFLKVTSNRFLTLKKKLITYLINFSVEIYLEIKKKNKEKIFNSIMIKFLYSKIIISLFEIDKPKPNKLINLKNLLFILTRCMAYTIKLIRKKLRK